jgi:hypothetical protein
MVATVSRPSRPGRPVFLSAFLLISLISVLWALATPIFASPDENAHAVKAIAQVRGEVLAHSRPGSRFPVYDLPNNYRYTPGIVCFAFQPQVSAACDVGLGYPGGTNFSDDWVSTYNPIYYYAVGWVTLIFDGNAGVYAMRILSALFCSALLAGAFVAALGARRARWMPAGLAFLAAPMGMFLAGSVNPQGIEVCAGALLTVALLRLVEAHVSPEEILLSRTGLWLMTAIGGSLLAVARATGPLWVLIIVVGALLASGWQSSLKLFRRRSSYPWIGAIAVFGLFSLVWTLATGALGGQAEKADAPLVGGSFFPAVWLMLRNTPRFVQSAAGVFGWQDTELPAVVYAVIFGALAIFFALAVFATRRRERLIIIASLIVAVLVPVVVQSASVAKTGIIWQGRYALFLYLAVILLAAWALSRSGDRIAWLSWPISATINAMMAVYGAATFLAVLRRYVVGTDNTVNKMVTAPEWQPPLTWPVLMGLLVLSLVAFALWNSRNALRLARVEDAESEPAPIVHD